MHIGGKTPRLFAGCSKTFQAQLEEKPQWARLELKTNLKERYYTALLPEPVEFVENTCICYLSHAC